MQWRGASGRPTTGSVEPENLAWARWDVVPTGRYKWASVQTVRGCPNPCSFCSVWKTDGQRPRQRTADLVPQAISSNCAVVAFSSSIKGAFVERLQNFKNYGSVLV